MSKYYLKCGYCSNARKEYKIAITKRQFEWLANHNMSLILLKGKEEQTIHKEALQKGRA